MFQRVKMTCPEVGGKCVAETGVYFYMGYHECYAEFSLSFRVET